MPCRLTSIFSDSEKLARNSLVAEYIELPGAGMKAPSDETLMITPSFLILI